MSGVTQKIVAGDEAGLRLDRWFKRHYPGLSFGALSKLMRTGQVRVDGKRVQPNARIEPGQVVRVPPLPDNAADPGRPAAGPTVSSADDAMIKAAVLHRDRDVIVLNKPAGLAVQGGSGTHRHVDGMLDSLRFDAAQRPRLVHRLDKDTSGLLLLARHAKAAAHLADAFKARTAHKVYWALVTGLPVPDQGQIDLALDKQPGRGGEKMVTTDDGKRAVTLYAVRDHAGRKAAWVALKPVTGRTHQLRAHMAGIGHAIVGDGKYGGREAFLGGAISRKMHLHARRLRLDHPSGGILDVEAPLSDHMRASWDMFGWDERDALDPFLEAGL